MKYLFVLLLLVTGVANAGNVVLTWTFDTSTTATCADGSPASGCPVNAFQVQEQINGIWTAKSPNISGSLRTTTYTNVSAGQHCYRILANSNGTLSVPSNESCVTVAPSAPKAPTITVTVAIGSP